MIKRFSGLIFLLGLTVAAFGQSTSMNLQECLQYAEIHNLTLQSGNLDVDVAEIQLKQAKARQYPTVSAGLSQSLGYSHGSEALSLGGNYNLNAGIEIFNGLTIRNSIKQSELRESMAELQVTEARDQIRVEIIRTYLTILMNQEMLEHQRNVLNTSREQVVQGELRLRAGRILESDYKMLQAQYLSDSMSIENTLITITNEYLTLHDLLNMDYDQVITVVVPDSSRLAQSMQLPDLQTVIQQALDYLPELKVKKKAVEIAEYDVKIAKGAYYPSISASAGIGTGYNAAYGSDVHGLTSGLYKGLGENVGLNVNIPIYRQSEVRNNVKIKNIQVQQAEISLEDAEGDVISEITEHHLTVQKAYNDYVLSELQQEAYYLNFLTYSQKFQHGTITAVELLQQQTNYLSILSNFMQNKYNFLLQKKILEVYTGQAVTL
jgi:outer membrane protein